jgi:hypothetical protein
MPSLLSKKNSVLFPEGFDTHSGKPEPTGAVKHKWVQQGNGFVCVSCDGRHTVNVGADKYKVDNYNLKRL